MKKQYNVVVTERKSVARSKRLRESGQSSSGTVISVLGGNSGGSGNAGDGHTHENLLILNRIKTDKEDYLTLRTSELDEETGAVTTSDKRAKVGYADEAGHAVNADNATHADKAHDVDDDSPVYERFLRKDVADEAAEHIKFRKGSTVENGLIVRLPKQDTPAALMSCLLEEDIDTLIEEDEDAIVEIAPAEFSDLSFGGLSNVNSSVDSAPIGSLPVKGENEWSYVAPTLYAGVVDADNMLVPVFDRRTQTMVFIPISAIRGGVTPPPTGFPYTFSFALR